MSVTDLIDCVPKPENWFQEKSKLRIMNDLEDWIPGPDNRF